jgi:hypothetical protein
MVWICCCNRVFVVRVEGLGLDQEGVEREGNRIILYFLLTQNVKKITVWLPALSDFLRLDA